MSFRYVQIVFYLFLFCSFSSAQKQYSIKFNDKEIANQIMDVYTTNVKCVVVRIS